MDLSKYYAEICKQPLLSKEEEQSLFETILDESKSGKEKSRARDLVVRSNLRFVFKTAKIASKNAPELFPELISAGNEGLMVAVDKYDVKSGFRFLTYAGWWVKQRIWECMADQRIVSLPVRKQQIASRIEKLVSHNPSISTEELIAALPDISEKDIKELRATNFLTFYIEDMLPSPSSPNDLGAEELEEFKIDPIGAEVNKRLDSEKLALILSKLKEEEFKVIDLLFGFSQEKCLKIPAIAKALGRSKEEIKAIRDQALSTISVSLNGVNPLSD